MFSRSSCNFQVVSATVNDATEYVIQLASGASMKCVVTVEAGAVDDFRVSSMVLCSIETRPFPQTDNARIRISH